MADYYVDGSGDAIPVLVNLDAYKGVPPHKPLAIKVSPTATWLSTATVDLDAMKAYLRVDGTDEDGLITGLMDAAVSYCQQVANKTFVASQVTVTYSDFPPSSVGVLASPVASRFPSASPLPTITYYDNDGAQRVLTMLTDFNVALSGENLYWLPSSGEWPTDYDRTGPRQISLDYQVSADSGNPSDRQVWVAVQMLVGHWYNTRDAVCDGNPKEIPFGVKALLQNNTFYGGFV